MAVTLEEIGILTDLKTCTTCKNLRAQYEKERLEEDPCDTCDDFYSSWEPKDE